MASFSGFPICWVAIVTLFSAAIAGVPSVHSATLVVTTTADSGPGSLRDTIAAAGSGDVIQFDPALSGQTIILTSDGLAVGSGITIDGPGASLLTVQRADGAPSFSIFRIGQYGNDFTISGLTIANGGSGIFIDSVGFANVTIANCSIIGNARGVYCGPGAGPPNTVTIINSTISGNIGSGGIYNAGGDCLGCVLSSPCQMTVNNTTISGNSVFRGGGIYNMGLLTVTNSTISGNAASLDQSGGGGGIATGGTMTLMNSTVSGNSGYQGGGILHIENNLLFLDGNGLTLINATITANSATEGGGIYTHANYTAHTRNSMVALNVAPSSPDIEGPMISEGFNLVGNNSGADISPPQVSDQIGTPAAPIDPLLGPLQDNGGPTFTHALLPGSPAIDKGHSSGSTADQRGFVRPVDFPDIPNAPDGDGADIGALESAAATLANISTRLRVETGDNAMIGGLIVTGPQAKTVIVRGLGPSLGIPGALADPVIEVYGSAGQLFATNDNWRDGVYAAQVASTLPPSNDLESALWGILTPGAYTFVVRGKNDTTGIGLFEVYDLDQAANAKLVNISTRGLVGTNNDVMIGGMIIIGSHPGRVIVRAIGPSLTNFGVPNALQNPTFELHDGNGALLASNDNWRTDQQAEIIATGIPPSNDLESAIVRTITPGNYTAIVRGVSNTTGIAVVEAYELN